MAVGEAVEVPELDPVELRLELELIEVQRVGAAVEVADVVRLSWCSHAVYHHCIIL